MLNATIRANNKKMMSKQEGREIADKGRKKKQRGAGTTLSRLWVISLNIPAVASLLASDDYF